MAKTKAAGTTPAPKAARKFETVAAELEEVRAEYRKTAHKLTPPEVQEYNEIIKKLMDEQDRAIRGDAPPCPNCGGTPHGRVKFPGVPERKRADGRLIPAQAPTFEVMCIKCEAAVQAEQQRRQADLSRRQAGKPLKAGEEAPPVPEPDMSDVSRPPVGSGLTPEAARTAWKEVV